MSTPRIQEWSMTGNVSTTRETESIITRQVPTFSVSATTAREALSKWREIVTSAWRGPCKVTFDLGMCDEAGNYWQATQDGLKD
tara:strand:+ start:308 stop:559 length:252 start_codon:yes stop_codon:yes gene_type:complete